MLIRTQEKRTAGLKKERGASMLWDREAARRGHAGRKALSPMSAALSSGGYYSWPQRACAHGAFCCARELAGFGASDCATVGTASGTLGRNEYPQRAGPRGMEELVFATVLLDLMDKSLLHRSVLRVARRFCTFLPCTLICAYIYLRQYVSRIGQRFTSVEELSKMYLVCCVLATKYGADAQVLNTEAAQKWGLPLGELNYLEALMINALNYNLRISDEEYRACYKNIQNNRCITYSTVAHHINKRI
ncbi:hypothetical protein PAPHI01_0238 [Pancytospora philotis]|nr:hypothetical protein PAPHI01_0238 [Pancytospora philotis]